MTDRRMHIIDPSTLEMILTLRVNKDLRDEKTVKRFTTQEKVEARANRSARQQVAKEAAANEIDNLKVEGA
jgi:hypothetical protein